MPFIVVREGPPQPPPDPSKRETFDYAKLVSMQLLRSGAQLDRVPRVRPEGDENAWLCVWKSRDEALAAAEELTRRTGDPSWQVRAVEAQLSLGPLRPLEIDVGRQRDGWVFALEPLTRMAVERRFPGSCRFHSLFIAADEVADFLRDPPGLPRLGRQVLLILTGLEAVELQVFGDFQVIDAREAKPLSPPVPIRDEG